MASLNQALAHPPQLIELNRGRTPLQVVAIKKVLQDKRFKNRELQMMRMLAKKDHPNIVSLKHCFYSNGDKVHTYRACVAWLCRSFFLGLS